MQKNYLATLFLSLGVPMLLGGDEFGRTQIGNNNAYCQDNEISWINWNLLGEYSQLHRFCRELIAFRKSNPAFTRKVYFPHTSDETLAEVLWLDEHGQPVDWESASTPLSYKIQPRSNNGTALYLIFNNSEMAQGFRLPPGAWSMRINTGRHAPEDIFPSEAGAPMISGVIEVAARSVVALSQSIPAAP
jgi:glycogen operon protein